MNRTQSILCKAFVLLAPVGVAVAVASSGDASAQYVVAPPPPPPPAFVATVSPEYYEGHPVYLYNDHWYYRDARGGWNYYHTEPQYLHDRRPHAAAQPRYHYHR
jgi:hypothetical protein